MEEGGNQAKKSLGAKDKSKDSSKNKGGEGTNSKKTSSSKKGGPKRRDVHDKKRAKVIYNDKNEDKIYENIETVEKQMTKKDVEFIIECFTKHFLFVNLNEDELEDVVMQMFYCVVKKGDYVFRQGDDASCFFIIDSGNVSVEIDGSTKKTISNSDYFGELALLYNAPRSASIKASVDSHFWAIDRKTFKKVVQDITTKNFQENRKFLDDINFFKSMTGPQKDSIAAALISQKFEKDKIIVNKGDQANSYYIIKKVS